MTKETFILLKADNIMASNSPWYVDYSKNIELYSFEDEHYPNELLTFMYNTETKEVAVVED